MKGFIKTILLVFFAVIAAILFLIWREHRDLTNYVMDIDSAVNDVLVKAGVKDIDVVHEYRREKKKGNVRWIEITREIKLTALPDDKNFSKIKADILKSVEKFGLDISTSKSKDGKTTLLFKKEGRTFLNLILQPQGQVIVALVMDDLGYDDKRITEYLSLGIPITYAVLPKEKYTRALVKILSKHKALYMMHQPMEPEHMESKKNYPGKAALLLKMTDEQNEKMLEENLLWVQGAYGINNHMGSEFTQHHDRMKYLMGVLKKKRLVFFDSSTSNKAVGKKTADEVGVPASYNNVFLDMEDDKEKIRKQLMTLLVVAKKHGRAAAICHITKKQLYENLKEIIPVFRQNGVEFVSLKDYIENR